MRDVFEPLRDVPEPPLRPAVEVLAAARRQRRRRTALRATAGGVAVLVGLSLAVDRVRLSDPAPEAAAPASPVATTTMPAAPAPEAVNAHAEQVARALIGAVPAGYHAASVRLTGDTERPGTYRVRVSITKGGYRAVTLVRVTAANGYGVVAAMFGNDLPAPGPGADPCAAHRDLGIEGATITGCRMVRAAGTPVRVVEARDPDVGKVMSALRYLAGGYVVVSAGQGGRAYRVSAAGDKWVWEVAVNPRNEPPLAAMPFTADRLAALAVDPALLP